MNEIETKRKKQKIKMCVMLKPNHLMVYDYEIYAQEDCIIIYIFIRLVCLCLLETDVLRAEP